MFTEDLLENTCSTWPARNILPNAASHPLMSPNSHSSAAPQSQGHPIVQIRLFRKPAGALTETMPWGYINRYNPRQSQPALGGLTPSGYSNQAKDKRGKLKVRGRRRAEPADPEGARVKPGNAAPEPPILERKAREVQDHAITTSHPQRNQKYSDNHPYSYTGLLTLRCIGRERMQL